MPWRTNVGTPFGEAGEEHDIQASPGDRSDHLLGDWDTSLVDDSAAHLFGGDEEPGEASTDGEVLAVSDLIGSLWIKFQLHMVMEWAIASFSIW